MLCEYCGEEGGNHSSDCPTWERFEDNPGEWAVSLRAIAGATSYEDYLARVSAQAGWN